MSKIKVLDRFKNYKIINEIIKEKIENANNKCLVPLGNNTYSLNNTIILLKKIGTESSYGSVYLSVIKRHSKIKFITKIQVFTYDAMKEIRYLKLLTKYAYLNKNIHLPIIYNTITCDYFNKNNNKLPENLLKKSNNINSYNSLFVELANGDLNNFLKTYKKINIDLIHNILAQCFIGILTLHNNNIIHNDTHIGNFLYFNIYKKGCFKYTYKDLIFYIENIGFNWVIWDFGLSKDLNHIHLSMRIKYIIKDYITLLKSFIKHLINAGIYDNDDMIEIKKYINNNFVNEYIFFKLLIKNNLLFSKNPIGTVITTIKL